jgi:branched-chain amino acid transport system substrate-binding protein
MDWNSWVSVSCMEVSAKYKIPHFFSFGATETVNEKYKSNPDKYYYWVGKAWPTPDKLSQAYVSAINEAVQNGLWKPKVKTVALYGVDNDWGRSFGASLAKQFTDTGWKVVDKGEWISIGETEFYPLLNKLKDENASLIAGTMSDPSSVSSFIKQAREVNLKSLIITDGLGWIGEWYKLTGKSSDYVIDQIPQFVTPEAKDFHDKFVAKYNFEPGAITSGICYDYTNYLIKVLNRCNEKYDGIINKTNLAALAKDEIMTGKLDYTDGIIIKDYKYTAETYPDPVVGKGYYIYPVVQYFGGKATVVWPGDQKQQDLKVPDNLQ